MEEEASQFLGQIPRRTEEQIKSFQIWCCFYVILERFDRKICTSQRADTAIPADSREAAIARYHAFYLKEEVFKLASELKLDSEVFKQEEALAARMTHSQLEPLADQSDYYPQLHQVSCQLAMSATIQTTQIYKARIFRRWLDETPSDADVEQMRIGAQRSIDQHFSRSLLKLSPTEYGNEIASIAQSIVDSVIETPDTGIPE